MTATPAAACKPSARRVNSGGMKNLDELKTTTATLEEAIEKRARLIVEARTDGWPWDAIANAAKLTRPGAEKMAKRANGGVLPRPRQRVTEAAAAESA